MTNVALHHIVPDLLHIVMALVQTLFRRFTDRAAGGNLPLLQRDIEIRLKSLGITLIPSKAKHGNKARTYQERVEKTRLQRPQCLKLLVSQHTLLEALDMVSTTESQKKRNEKVELQHNCLHKILSEIC